MLEYLTARHGLLEPMRSGKILRLGGSKQRKVSGQPEPSSLTTVSTHELETVAQIADVEKPEEAVLHQKADRTEKKDTVPIFRQRNRLIYGRESSTNSLPSVEKNYS